MVWWSPLVGVIGVIVGVLLGYFLTRISASKERKLRERSQLRSAIGSILAEVETNLKLAEEPWRGRLIPFVTYAWDVHKGHALGLPRELQVSLYGLYVKIQMANSLFQYALMLDYGKGYYNNDYKECCNEIAKEAKKARELLARWLNGSMEAVVIDEGNRKSP